MSYRVGISNVFDLLQADDDDEVKTVKVAPAAVVPPTTQKAQQPAPAKQQQQQQQQPQQQQQQQQQQGGRSQDRKNAAPGENRERAPRQNRDGPRTDRTDRPDRPPRDPNAPRRDRVATGDGSDARKNDRAPRAPREGRPDRTDNRGGKRLDRHPGSGRAINDSTRRGGAGKGNWDTPEGELAGVEIAIKEGQDEAAQLKETPVVEAGPEKTPEELEAQRLAEEEAKRKTYDEHLKDLAAKAPKVAPAQPLRKPGEGVDNNAWAQYVPLKREDEESAPKAKSAAAEKGKKAEDEPKDVKVANLIHFKLPPRADDDRRGGDRRGGGGDRRGGAGGGPRGGQRAPNAGGPRPGGSPAGGRGGRDNRSGAAGGDGGKEQFDLSQDSFPGLPSAQVTAH